MGCFNVVCNLSGLPIYSGDKVQAVLCLPSTDTCGNDVSTCYSTALKVPALLPVRGKYDDYGSIEYVQDDASTILLNGFFEDRLKGGSIKYTDRYSVYNFKDDKGCELWYKLVSCAAITIDRWDHKSKRKGHDDVPLSIAFILQDAYDRFLAPNDTRVAYKTDADHWFKWYVEMHQKVRKWEDGDNDRRSRSYMLVEDWGQRAKEIDLDKHPDMFGGLKLPKLVGAGKWGNVFQDFFRGDDRKVWSYWFKDRYFNFLKNNIEASDLKDVADKRWVNLRDCLVDFIPLCHLMDRLHRTWLPTVTAGQDGDDDLFLAASKVNAAISKNRIRKWKRENGE